ncbi:unnamed protein product [Brachionus calyciflorus]|uniref:Nucleotide-diphospho-sugar transferase domain-containing protein n=1 Tax=Brachionus calyciflorus TaxID=104777 RepID=A0A814CIP6_9BILA|nr:unnamed protein product [Brachionus calyciflorus]
MVCETLEAKVVELSNKINPLEDEVKLLREDNDKLRNKEAEHLELSMQPNTKNKIIEHKLPLNIKKYGHRNAESNVTVVTMFHKFSKSKHSLSEYELWVSNFFSSVRCPIAIFIDRESFNFVNNLSHIHKLNITFFITNSVWDIIEMLEEKRDKKYIQNYKTIQNSLDPEKSIHNPSLYAAWNAKHFMCKFASDLNLFKSDFFIYTDIGAWRNSIYPNWPDVNFVNKVKLDLQDRILYGQINKKEMIDDNPRIDSIEGTFFAGSKKAIDQAHDAFYKIHDEWFDMNMFVGKDQTIMNVITFKRYSHLVKRLMSWSAVCKKYYDVWFFYQAFFASQDQFQCENDKLSLIK